MKELINYICTVIEEKYNVQMVNGPICTQGRDGLPCICISGEMLSQAVNSIFNFIRKPDFFSKLLIEDDVFFPVIMQNVNKEEKLYIGINRENKGLFKASEINRESCYDKDNRYYIKLKHDPNMKEKKQYSKEIEKQEELVRTSYTFAEKYSKRKYKFVIKILSKIRIANNRKLTHFAFLELMLFLSPTRMHNLLKELLEKNNLSREQAGTIIEFLVKHTQFIIELSNAVKNEDISLQQFSLAFAKIFSMDMSHMIADHLEKEKDIQDFVSMISTTLLTNLRGVSTSSIKIEVDMLRDLCGEEHKDDLEEIERSLEVIKNINTDRKNRSLPSKYAFEG